MVPTEALLEVANQRIQKLREGILEARKEGCACDFHLYWEDEDLLADDTLDAYCTQAQENAALQNRIGELERQETGALYLVAQIREALGDNGTRMQDELLDYCRELAQLYRANTAWREAPSTPGCQACAAMTRALIEPTTTGDPRENH